MFSGDLNRRISEQSRLESWLAWRHVVILLGMRPFKITHLFLVLLFAACATNVRTPKGEPPTRSAAYQAWERVLKNNVADDGRINFAKIESQYLADLEVFVKFISMYRSPNRAVDERKADWVNFYNALAMYNVVRNNRIENLQSFGAKYSFFFNTRFVIEGDLMSLYTFENKFIRGLKDSRVHWALNCMSAGCPRLPNHPFTPETVDAQFNAEAKKFFNENRNVKIDPGQQTVKVTEIMKFFKSDFVRDGGSLLAYVNKYRVEKVPEEYKVEFIPYDWTIYRQKGGQK